MAFDVARYQFQSWVRKGVSTQIREQDALGDPAAVLPVAERASVAIGVSINTAPQDPKPFELIGPGDIIGIHRDMIVRTEPRRAITNFEPNYLAFIEFYDEDFPWRYTPAKPDGEKLRPWVALLVLRDDEFVRDDRRVPLPVVTVKRKEALPRADESWLFAHSHLEQEIPASELSDLERYLKSLQETITTDPDRIYSRLLSPRHLDPNTAYHAFLTPAFEVGRLSGLNKATTGVPAQKPAWDGSNGVELPFYYDWAFSTGEKVDFEELVGLLKPRALDERIGVRSMDCGRPGYVLVDASGRERAPSPGAEPGLPAAAPRIQGLEGALKTNRTKSAPQAFSANAFQDELQLLVNLPETIVGDTSAAPGADEDFLKDPIVTLPFYGQNHARQRKTDKVLLDVAKTGWLHDLNRDPRTRTPAGLGVIVIQKNQEKFVQRAWRQVQKVYEANRAFRQGKFSVEVAVRYTQNFFSVLAPPQFMAVTSAVHAKVLGSPTTIRQQVQSSALRAPVFSSAFRRLARPAGKLAQRLTAQRAPLRYDELVEAVNSGRVDPAPPRQTPAGLPSADGLADKIRPKTLPAWLLVLIRRRRAALLLVLALLLLVGLFSGGWAFVAIAAAMAGAGYVWLNRQAGQINAVAVLTDPVEARRVLIEAPSRRTFSVRRDDEASAPPATPGPRLGGDSVEAAHFREAAMHFQNRLAIRAPEPPPPPPFNMNNGYAKVAHAINPRVSFHRRLSALVSLPPQTAPPAPGGEENAESFVDAMAHPDFEDATYAHLRDISKELLIPNLNLIPPNTISLLETNPKFIEAYLVGLNHEMGRELLWREYPTDMRGSYFRQFWEVKGVSNPDTPEDAEQLKDVTKLHAWPAASALGAHKPPPGPDADVQPGEKQVVLVIRGELLKRYPNTVIYAQKAIRDGRGARVIKSDDLTSSEFETHLKFPLFRAEIDPDLRFFGFDLTIEKARGAADSRDFPNDKLGWFFIIQEVPGEPRFGMDIAYKPTVDAANVVQPNTWNNLAWNSFGASEPAFVTRTPQPSLPPPSGTDLGAHQWGVNAAQMAYILYQTPVMIAVHADEMLKNTDA